MQLPETPDGGLEIGISDILAYRDCAARFALGMERWSEAGELPGQTNESNAFGSCVHDTVHYIEGDGLTVEAAIEKAWGSYGRFLDPDDLVLLKEDIAAYRGDTPIGFELVGSEMDGRVPLFVHEGKQVFFRFRLDALYRRIGEPTVFLLRDLKSSKWRKTQAEVDADIQMWSYSFGVHELYVECQSLLISYEQLRHGNLMTSRNAEQRKAIRGWLIQTVKVMLADETLAPTRNRWCPWCELLPVCDVTKRATAAWKGRLAVLAPQTKEGRKTKLDLIDEGDQMRNLIKVVLPEAIETRKHLEAFEKALKKLIEEMPLEQREELGWRLADRKSNTFSPEALRTIHEAMGPSFYQVISLSKTAVDAVVGKPAKGEPVPHVVQVIENVQLKKVSSTSIEPA